MKIGIVSDTHGHIHNTIAAVRLLGEHTLEAVIHCGDIGTPEVIPYFADWPTHFIFGNCDTEAGLLKSTIREVGQTCHDRFGDLTLNERKIAFLHSDDHRRFINTINSQEFDLVCYGHTHKYEQHLQGKTLVLNPGALYRAKPFTLAIVELETMLAEHFVVETALD